MSRIAELESENERLRRRVAELENQPAQEQLEYYRQFFSQSFEGIYRTEFDHPIDTSLPVETQIDLIYANAYMAECNQALADMYHLSSPAALVNSRLIDAHGGKDNPVNRAAFRVFIEKGYKSYNDETVELTADGMPVWFLSNTIGTLQDGKLVRMWGTSIDNTQRKLAEQLVTAQRDLAYLLSSVAFPLEAWQRCLEITLQLTAMDCGGIYLLSEANGQLELAAQHGMSAGFMAISALRLREPANLQMILAGQSLFLDAAGLSQDPDAVKEGMKLVGSLPLMRQGQALGCIILASHSATVMPSIYRQAFEAVAVEISNLVLFYKTYRSLRESSAAAQAILNAVTESVFLIDGEGKVITANETAARRLNKSLPDFIGQVAYDLVPKDVGINRKIRVQEALHTGKPVRFEDQRFGRWLENTIYPILAEDGQARYVVIYTVDITERRYSEINLRASEERYRGLLASMDSAVAIVDAEGTFLYVNDRIAEQQDSTPAILAGKNIRQLFPEPEAAHQLENVQKAILSDQRIIEETQGIAHQQLRWYRVTIQPVHDPMGRVVHALLNMTDIHDLKVIQQELTELTQNLEERVREGKAELQDLYDYAPVGYYSLDATGRLLRANQVWYSWLGYTPQEVIGQPVQDFLSPSSCEKFQKNYPEFIQSGSVKDLEMELLRKDGSILPALINATALYDAHGNYVMSRSSLIDISERKRAEEKIRASSELFQKFLYYSPVHAFIKEVTSERSLVLYASENFADMIGIPGSQIVGKTMYELFPAEFAAKITADDWQVVSSGSVIRLEEELSGRSYTTIKFPIIDGQRTLLAGYTIDLTDRKRAEDSLRESEARFRALFDQTHDAVFMIDLEGHHTAANARAADMLGYTEEELMHLSIKDISADLNQSQGILVRTLAGERIPPYERRFRKKDGQIINVEINLELIRDKHGEPSYLQSVVRDITIRKQAEEALRSANQMLEHAMRTKDDFLANMSHELRTPLTGILGGTEIMLKQVGGPLTERQQKYIQIIDTSGRHLLALINDILDLSKIEAGKVELEHELLQVSETCKTSLAFVKEQAQKKSVSLEFHCEPEQFSMVADARRLKQILANLLGNAVKFTPAGGQVRLAVSADVQLMQVHFSVTDTGVGISAENLAVLFRPFTQVDSSLSRRHEGTGLGLSLVKSLVEMHGGRVSVESEVGKGSCFTVTLPWLQTIDQVHSAQRKSPQSARPSATVDSLVRKRILLAEDNNVTAEVIQDFLRQNGYEVIHARDGVRVLTLVQEFHPDLVLMDVQMPLMDGLEAMRRLRQMSDFRIVPIIALTALAMRGDRERCLEAGANEYLSKPLNLTNLLQVIGSFMR